MTPPLPPIRLTGATVLRDRELQQRSVAIADGRIAKGPFPEVDLTGYLVLPGIIDLHGDSFEHQLFPRPTAPFPVDKALAATDREAAACGVTTAWLAQSWSWEGGHRGPDQAEHLLAALAAYRPRALTDLRVQIRAETHMIDEAPRLLAAVERFSVDYVVFNNHLEEGLQLQRMDRDRFAHWARKAGLSEKELAERMDTAWRRAREVPRSLCMLAEGFDRLRISYGSHDDPDAETREFFCMIGARIAEFPLTRKAAAAANAMGSVVVMGAPNVVRGGSQTGNVAAVDLIRQGLCDALVSDYHMPALAQAAWTLVDAGILPLERAWELISTGPAQIMQMLDRGRIAPGLRADLIVVNAETRAIEATLVAGRISYLAGEAARRFMAQPKALQLAAE